MSDPLDPIRRDLHGIGKALGVTGRFGARVRYLREGRGWSQEELADRAELHRTYIGGIERGERNLSLENIHKLADALGVPVWTLFFGE